MADRMVEIADTTPTSTTAAILTQERPSSTVAVALTVDPGTSGTTFTFASTALFTTAAGAGTFYAKVENEIVLATVASSTTLTVTRAQKGTAAAAHAIGKIVAMLADAQYVIPIGQRQVSYCGAAATFRMVGNAATSQNLFRIINGSGTAVIVGVRKLNVEMDSTAAQTAVAVDFKVSRSTGTLAGGTTMTKVAQDTALTSDANVVLTGGASADGTNSASAITGVTAGSTLWHQFGSRQQTAAGYQSPDDYNLIPAELADSEGITLRSGEQLLVQLVTGATTQNPNTNHYVVKCAWDEYTVP